MRKIVLINVAVGVLFQAAVNVAAGQVVNGIGTYKGAGPGWDRGMQTTMHCGNDPESWVRGRATLDKQSGQLLMTIELETDSILAGPKGHVIITLRDEQQRSLYVVTSDEIGTGGRGAKVAIRDYASTVNVPVSIAKKVDSLVLDAQCTGSVSDLFNLNLGLSQNMFEVFAKGSFLESSSGSPEAKRLVNTATKAAQSVSEVGTPQYTATLRAQVAGGAADNKKSSQPSSLDQDGRYRASFSDQTRVWGGDNVPPGTFPDTVAIMGNGKLCTGTVVGSKAILTAAHCLCEGVKETVYFGDSVHAPTSSVAVVSGKSMIPCDVPLQLGDGDVAILSVAIPLTIPPRAIASKELIDVASFGRAVGFGIGANPVIDPQGVKRMVDVPVASIACSGNPPISDRTVSDSVYYRCSSGMEIVAGAPSLNKDTCNGDSGGPMYVQTSDGSLYLAATVSRATGTPGIRPCGDGGIYVRLDGKVLQWIKDQGVHVLIADR